MKLKIAHLYPKLLNLYGDKGNIYSLSQRLEWRGIDHDIQEIDLGDKQEPLQNYHLVFIGGGQDSQQDLIAKDLILRKNEIKDLVEAGLVVLAICGGYQLLGQSYQTSDNQEIEGLGIIDVHTEAQARKLNKQKRLIGNVSAQLLIEGMETKTIVGFENHSGQTYINPQSKTTKPLAQIIKGFGNNGEDGLEGAIHHNVIGTYLHGSLLPKNPHLSDELIKRALQYAQHPYWLTNHSLSTLDDSIEMLAHQYALQL